MKKTLFISRYAPPSIGGAPQVMYTLMRDLPQESYVMLTSFYNIDSVSAEIGSWLNGKYIFYDNKNASKSFIASSPTKIQKKGRNVINNLRYVAKRSKIIRDLIGIPIIFIQLYSIVLTGRQTIKNNRIEVIMGFSDYGPALIGSYILHKITKTKLTLLIFDVYKGNLYPFPGNFMAALFEKLILVASSKVLVTNKATKDLYIERYGDEVEEKIVVMHNPTPVDHSKIDLKPYSPRSPYKIVFTGSVYWPQIGSLQNLVKAIENTDMRLEIYSATPKSVLEKEGLLTKEVDFMGTAPASDMPKVQGDADLLFLPLSWNTKNQVIVDTATPGKLADYLTSGRPILIHSPKSSCISQYGKEHHFALVVDENNPEILRSSILEFFKNPGETGDELVRNAKNFYDKYFNVKKNIEIFRSVLF